MFKKNKIIGILPLFSTFSLVPIVSCSNIDLNKEKIISQYNEWYKSLSYSDWNKNQDGSIKNAYSNSEQQSLYLYLNQWGDFWNESLHLQKEPQDTKKVFDFANSGFLPNVEYGIRGEDYKYIDSALEKAIAPLDMTVYHGVEWLEKEFYDQLKDYIKDSKNGKDYSQTIGKTIESFGYISTSLNKKYVIDFVDGKNWITNKLEPPLLEPAMFLINIKKGTKGVAWVSNPFKFMGLANSEEQVMIKRNVKYKIKDWNKDTNGVNVFTLDLLV